MVEMKFEEALEKLEKIAGALERGELSLDDSLKRYEEGVKLAWICTRKLEEAEKKAEILVTSGEGKKEKRPFEVSPAEKEEVGQGKAEGRKGKDEGTLF